MRDISVLKTVRSLGKKSTRSSDILKTPKRATKIITGPLLFASCHWMHKHAWIIGSSFT